MGNHHVGKAFNAAAKIVELDLARLTQEEALKRLDLIGEQYKDTDAEFDDYDSYGTPLWKWVVKCFATDKLDKWLVDFNDDDWQYWSDFVDDVFRKRYGFW